MSHTMELRNALAIITRTVRLQADVASGAAAADQSIPNNYAMDVKAILDDVKSPFFLVTGMANLAATAISGVASRSSMTTEQILAELGLTLAGIVDDGEVT